MNLFYLRYFVTLAKVQHYTKAAEQLCTPALSVIEWGRYAFDNDAELVKFFAMHGHTIVPLLDGSLYAEAEAESVDLPKYPEDGYIVDQGDYIIVHF